MTSLQDQLNRKINQRNAVNKTGTNSNNRNRFDRVEEIILRREESLLEEEASLFTWQAPSRIYQKRTKEYYTTIGAIVLLVCIILFFVGDFLLMAVIIAFSFVAYSFASVQPEKTTHEITSRGVRTSGRYYRWDELGRYWFDDMRGEKILYIETFKQFPRQLMMLIKSKDEDKFKDLLAPYLLLEKPEPSFIDKAASWLAEKVPLEGA